MPIATSPPATQSQSQDGAPSVSPPAATFSILPPLHPILSRLLSEDLSPKDLHTAAAPIFARIHCAKEVASQIDGGELGIKEQEELIHLLEDEVKRTEKVVRSLRESVGSSEERSAD